MAAPVGPPPATAAAPAGAPTAQEKEEAQKFQSLVQQISHQVVQSEVPQMIQQAVKAHGGNAAQNTAQTEQKSILPLPDPEPPKIEFNGKKYFLNVKQFGNLKIIPSCHAKEVSELIIMTLRYGIPALEAKDGLEKITSLDKVTLTQDADNTLKLQYIDEKNVKHEIEIINDDPFMLKHKSSSGKAEDKSDFDKIKALLKSNPKYENSESLHESALKTYNVAMEILSTATGLNPGECWDSKEFYTLTTLESSKSIFDKIRKPKTDATSKDTPRDPAKDATATPAAPKAPTPATADATKPADPAVTSAAAPAATTKPADATPAPMAATTAPAAAATAAAPTIRNEIGVNPFDKKDDIDITMLSPEERDIKNIPSLSSDARPPKAAPAAPAQTTPTASTTTDLNEWQNYLLNGVLENPKSSSDVKFTFQEAKDILITLRSCRENQCRGFTCFWSKLDFKDFEPPKEKKTLNVKIFIKRLLLLISRLRGDLNSKGELKDSLQPLWTAFATEMLHLGEAFKTRELELYYSPTLLGNNTNAYDETLTKYIISKLPNLS